MYTTLSRNFLYPYNVGLQEQVEMDVEWSFFEK